MSAYKLIEGWWSFDESRQLLVRTDGAAIRFRGNSGGEGSSALIRPMQFTLDMRHGESFGFRVERIERQHLFGRRLGWRAYLPAKAPDEAIDLLLDGFSHWPANSNAGVRPGTIQVLVEGCERRPSLFSTGAATLFPKPRPGREVPRGLGKQQWQWVAPEAGAGPLPPLPAFDEIGPEDARGLVIDALKLVPILTCEDATLFPLWLEDSLCHWAYFDREFLTDRIALPLPFKGQSREWAMRAASGVRLGTRVLPGGALANLDSGPIRTKRIIERGTCQERASLPPEWTKRIHDAILAASFLWQDCTIAFELPDGERKQVDLLAPDKVVSGWASGPRGQSGQVTQSRRPLDEEQPSSYLGGRILVDSNPPMVRDVATNRSLAFEATLDGRSHAEEHQKFRLEYRDSHGSASLTVERRPRDDPWHDKEWVADLRDGRFDRFEEPRWRAARQFIGGALCHWPDSEVTGPAPPGVRLLGAMLNGKWDANAAETVWSARLPVDDADGAFEPTIEPIRRWHLDTRAYPTGLIDPPAEIGDALPAFDRSCWSEKFPDRSAWFREDDKAVYSFAGMSPVRGHGGGGHYFDYWDEDIWARLYVDRNQSWTTIGAAGPVEGASLSFEFFVRRDDWRRSIQPLLWNRLREIKEAIFAANPKTVVRISDTIFAGKLLTGGSRLYDVSTSPQGDIWSGIPR